MDEKIQNGAIDHEKKEICEIVRHMFNGKVDVDDIALSVDYHRLYGSRGARLGLDVAYTAKRAYDMGNDSVYDEMSKTLRGERAIMPNLDIRIGENY